MFEIGKGSGAEEEIRSLLWQMSRTVNDEELPALRQYAIITELLHVLFVQCRRKKPEPAANDTHYAVSIIKAGGEISGRSSNN